MDAAVDTAHSIPVSPATRADDPDFDKARADGTHEVLDDIAYKRLAIVNIAFIGFAGSGNGNWVLVDAGIPGTTNLILNAVNARFGKNAVPAAILMTHGHFDHVGTLKDLAQRWQVPIYAHRLEFPYLNGTASYPPPDPGVGGGLMAVLSPLFPRSPIDVSAYLQPLPDDGTIPVLPGWRWLHTPGHSPGHVSYWRDSDRTLIVGDAFVTTAQESAYAALTQRPEMHGPPMYFTPDWVSAEASVRKLAELQPEIVVPGHGRAMYGGEMRSALALLARDFGTIAVPDQGKYVP